MVLGGRGEWPTETIGLHAVTPEVESISNYYDLYSCDCHVIFTAIHTSGFASGNTWST